MCVHNEFNYSGHAVKCTVIRSGILELALCTAALLHDFHFWTNRLIQMCLIIVVVTTEVRQT